MSDWSQFSHGPSVSEVRSAALLAWEGYLTSVKYMNIRNMDISDIPCDQMAKLASIVTDRVVIWNITHNLDLSSILVSVQLDDMELRETETRALVTAMRDRVERVWLCEGVTFDIEELCQYDGRGICRGFEVWGDMRRYGDRLRRWASGIGWTPIQDYEWELDMERKSDVDRHGKDPEFGKETKNNQ